MRLYRVARWGAFLMILSLGGCGGGGSGATQGGHYGDAKLGASASTLPASGLEFCCDDDPPPHLPLEVGQIVLSPKDHDVVLDSWYEPVDDDDQYLEIRHLDAPVEVGRSLPGVVNQSLAVTVHVKQCYEGVRHVTIRTRTHALDTKQAAFSKTFSIPVTSTCPSAPGEPLVFSLEVTRPEGFTLAIGPQFGLPVGRVGVVVFGSNGWEIRDPATGAQISRVGIERGGAFYGGAVLRAPGSPDGDTLVCGGPTRLSAFAWVGTDFGFQRILESGNVTDCHATGDGSAAIFADFTSPSIGFVAFNAASLQFEIASRYLFATEFPASERPVCATADSLTSDIYYATEESGTGQGRLYVRPAKAGPGDPSTPIGRLGLEPRRIAKVGDAVVVSNFGSDSVTVANAALRAIVEEIAVGSKPLGLACRDEGDGTATVLVANLGSNSVSRLGIALTAEGPIVKDRDWFLAPVAVRGMGHVGFVGNRVMVTGNETDNAVVTDAP